jgi:hypothetical protein
LCSSITAPALTSIGEELHIPGGAQLQLVLSVYLLAYALGPFVLSPCSEVWGRMPVIRTANVVFLIFTTLCGFATSQSQITAFRFLAGLGGSASVGVCYTSLRKMPKANHNADGWWCAHGLLEARGARTWLRRIPARARPGTGCGPNWYAISAVEPGRLFSTNNPLTHPQSAAI